MPGATQCARRLEGLPPVVHGVHGVVRATRTEFLCARWLRLRRSAVCFNMLGFSWLYARRLRSKQTDCAKSSEFSTVSMVFMCARRVHALKGSANKFGVSVLLDGVGSGSVNPSHDPGARDYGSVQPVQAVLDPPIRSPQYIPVNRGSRTCPGKSGNPVAMLEVCTAV